MTKPTPSKRELLDVKRRELAEAEAQHAEAERTMNVEGTMHARERVAVLRQFVTRLEAESETELEAEGRAQAEAWLAAQPKKAAARAKAIAEAQAEARRLLGEALTAIQEETRLRREAARSFSSVHVLAARFALAEVPTLKDAPPVLDHAFDLLKASNALLGVASAATVRLSPVVTASDGPEQQRRATLRAVAELMTRRRHALPDDVAAILAHAPIPPSVLAVKAAPEMSEHEQRETRRMAEAARTTEAALSLVGNGTTGLGRGL